MCQSKLEIIMQLPLNTVLSNSLDYKILVIGQFSHYHIFTDGTVWHNTNPVDKPSHSLRQLQAGFSEVAFLLVRSVGQWTLGQISFPLVHMTRGHWPCSRVTMKNLEIKVAFLLVKGVCWMVDGPCARTWGLSLVKPMAVSMRAIRC